MRWLVVLCVLAGCSFIATRTAPRGSPPSCTGYVPAFVDLAVTAAGIAAAVALHAEAGCDGPDGCHNLDPTALAALPAAIYALSAAWGFTSPSVCRAALHDAPPRRGRSGPGPASRRSP